ncbi:hypothetical protein [Spartinivicinus poritis]|uniref:Uncharacterized protein n=1 Tax=Spartinivicinus poritis TaxID=2994640 RepID=A0ABT5UG44_9GAMM|nr:hypothetical protein [Spartinivicinus sp. A2-2]MDE1465352.1 hypothetical protein [Spartinivicinus sp. A2-2]
MKAPTIGLTPERALDETMLAGWKGFKVEWLQNCFVQRMPARPHRSTVESLSDRRWADGLRLEV